MKLCAVTGIKPNVSAFGADQFDESDPQVSWPPPLVSIISHSGVFQWAVIILLWPRTADRLAQPKPSAAKTCGVTSERCSQVLLC